MTAPLYSESSLNLLSMKHRLMYVDIRMTCMLKECLAWAQRSACQLDLCVERAVQDYKTYAQMVPHPALVEEVDGIFENHLEELYEKRVELSALLVKHLPSNSLRSPLKAVELELEEIVRALNMRGCALKEAVVEWEKSVDHFQENFKSGWAKRGLKTLCGKAYAEVLRKGEIRELYFSWEGILRRESQSLLYEETLWYALKVRGLFAKKNLFFRQFFSDTEDKARKLSVCSSLAPRKSENFCVARLLQSLNEQILEAKARITALEAKLITPIGYTTYFASGLVHLLTHNLYTKNAAFLVESQEKATQMPELPKVAFLSQPLQHSYLAFSKAVTAVGLLMLDLAEWQWLGVSHRMSFTISQELMPDSTAYITGFQRLGGDEKTALLWLPTASRALEFAVFVAISGCSMGFSVGSVGGAALSYGIGKGASLCAGQAVNLLYGANKEQSPTYPLVHGLAQWMAFPLAHRYVLSYLLERGTSFFVSREKLLTQETVCLANLASCRREACQFLGLAEMATGQEIKKAYRQMALQYHPDHNPSGLQIFRKATFAKKICSTA